MSVGKNELRVYDNTKLRTGDHIFGGKPVILTSMDKDDVHVMYYSQANDGTFSIPLRLLIEVYEDRMG